jgi:hypothetical protein
MSILELVLLVWACVATGMAWYYRTDARTYMTWTISLTEKITSIANGEGKVVWNNGKLDYIDKGVKK